MQERNNFINETPETKPETTQTPQISPRFLTPLITQIPQRISEIWNLQKVIIGRSITGNC